MTLTKQIEKRGPPCPISGFRVSYDLRCKKCKHKKWVTDIDDVYDCTYKEKGEQALGRRKDNV